MEPASHSRVTAITNRTCQNTSDKSVVPCSAIGPAKLMIGDVLRGRSTRAASLLDRRRVVYGRYRVLATTCRRWRRCLSRHLCTRVRERERERGGGWREGERERGTAGLYAVNGAAIFDKRRCEDNADRARRVGKLLVKCLVEGEWGGGLAGMGVDELNYTRSDGNN